jgi:hypothetical protein
MEASIRNMRWLPIERHVIEQLARNHGYVTGYHPTGFYSSLTERFLTVGEDHVVFVQEGMDENLVYQMVTSMLRDPDRVKSIAALAPFDPNEIWKDTVFPLHPGAERAFRDMGFMR